MTDSPSAQAPSAPSTPTTTSATPIVNTPTLVMGPSGSGKSSLLATLMEWAWEHYHAISFLSSFDGGGFPTQVQALIMRGICRLWRVQTRGEAEVPGTIQRAAEGWWPARINPITGECPANVALVPPMTTIYKSFCPAGHALRSSASKDAVMAPGPCPTCGTLTTSMNVRIETATERTKGFPEKRLVLLDGLSGAQDWYMADIAKRNLGGEKGAIDSFISDGVTIATASRAKIGSAQSQAQQWVKASANIPGLVVPAVWTALTQEATEEGGLTIIGPSLAGNAKTPLAPAWFGSTIEASVVRVDAKQYRRIYFHQFVDARGIRHLCRVGAYPGAFEPYWEEEEGAGAPFRAFNLGLFHQRLADARKSTEALYAERYQDAPGLPGEMASYGAEGAESSPLVPPAQSARGGQAPAATATAVATGPARPAGAPGGAPSGQRSSPQGGGVASPAVSKQTAQGAASTRAAVAPTGPAGVKRPAGAPGATATANPPVTSAPTAIANPSVMATGPLPPATIGPPKAPEKGPAPPPGRRPQ